MEIKMMRDEDEANAEADKQAREEVEKLNAADALIFSTEKQLKEYGGRLSDEKKCPTGGVRQYIPLKVNTAGVMPIIFALAIMFIPTSISSFFPTVQSPFLASFSDMSLTYNLTLSRLFTL